MGDERLSTGNHLGKQLCDALGIDTAGVHSLILECTSTGAATVTIKRYVTRDSGERAAEVLESRYQLMRRDVTGFGDETKVWEGDPIVPKNYKYVGPDPWPDNWPVAWKSYYFRPVTP